MKYITGFFVVFAMSSLSIDAHSANWACEDRGIKLAKVIIKSEKMYDGTIYDGEVRVSTKLERDKNGNAYEVVDVGFRVGPSQRIVSKYLVEEENCTLRNVQIK